MAEEKKERERREWNQDLRLKGGILAGLSLPVITKQLQSPIPITDADLKPGRMVEHELFARTSAAVVWLVFALILLAAALYRQRASMLVRRLSARLEDLLKPGDRAWILGAGVVLRVFNRANLEVTYAHPIDSTRVGGRRPSDRVLIQLTASLL